MKRAQLYAAHGKGDGYGSDGSYGDGWGTGCGGSGDTWGGGYGSDWSDGDGSGRGYGAWGSGDGVSKSCPNWEWALAVAEEDEAR